MPRDDICKLFSVLMCDYPLHTMYRGFDSYLIVDSNALCVRTTVTDISQRISDVDLPTASMPFTRMLCTVTRV